MKDDILKLPSIDAVIFRGKGGKVAPQVFSIYLVDDLALQPTVISTPSIKCAVAGGCNPFVTGSYAFLVFKGAHRGGGSKGQCRPKTCNPPPPRTQSYNTFQT